MHCNCGTSVRLGGKGSASLIRSLIIVQAIQRELKWWEAGSCSQVVKDINEASNLMHSFSLHYPDDKPMKPLWLSRGVHHTSIMSLGGHGDENPAYKLRCSTVFLYPIGGINSGKGTILRRSIFGNRRIDTPWILPQTRSRSKRYQCSTSIFCFPHITARRIGELSWFQDANAPYCNRGLQVHQRVISFLHQESGSDGYIRVRLL